MQQRKMGDLLFISLATSGVLILSLICRFFYFFWWRPIKLGRFLKDQGINGPPYWPVVGNIMEETRLRKDAKLRPMDLSHAIVPRVIPFLHRISQSYGISHISSLQNMINATVGLLHVPTMNGVRPS